MINPIESYLRNHVEIGRYLMAEREIPIDNLRTLSRDLKALDDRFGGNGLTRIHDRARALVRQLFGGEAAPPPPNYKIDGYAATEADIVAEKLVTEYRRAGVLPSRDPNWRDTLNSRYAMAFDVERLKQRVLEQRARRKAPPPPPPPAPAPAPATPKLEELVTAAVAREVAKLEKIRHAEVPATVTVVETRSGETVDVRAVVKAEVAAFHREMHRGVWQEGARYEKGQLVTRGGSTWSVQRDGAQGKPGESPDFLLIVKRGEDGRKR